MSFLLSLFIEAAVAPQFDVVSGVMRYIQLIFEALL